MVLPIALPKPRYVTLLSMTDYLVFASRSVNGLASLAHYCDITINKERSGKIRVNVSLRDKASQDKVTDIVYAGNFKVFNLKRPYKRKKA